MWTYPHTHARTHARTHTHTLNLSAPDEACPSLPPLFFVTVRRRQPSSGKPSLNLYCIYWSACCILLFICPCGWNSVCELWGDVKLSLSRRYFWRHHLSQLKPACGEIIRVNWGALQWQDDVIKTIFHFFLIIFILTSDNENIHPIPICMEFILDTGFTPSLKIHILSLITFCADSFSFIWPTF